MFFTEIFSADWSDLAKREPPVHNLGTKKVFNTKICQVKKQYVIVRLETPLVPTLNSSKVNGQGDDNLCIYDDTKT